MITYECHQFGRNHLDAINCPRINLQPLTCAVKTSSQTSTEEPTITAVER
jgi:hypothetical protein